MSGEVEPIEVVPYDPAWPAWFAAERERLRRALGGLAVAIEHAGSTAVPGLAAKPVLDIVVTAEPFPPPAEAVAALEALGYIDRGENGIPGRRYFRTRPHARHLHVFPPGHPEAERMLRFRDYLRACPEVAATYAALKRELAARHRLDREAYVAGKTAFVRDVDNRARARARRMPLSPAWAGLQPTPADHREAKGPADADTDG